MARKDFDSYFMVVSKQYQELNKALEELSKEVEQGMFEPERLEQLKATILPVKNSYETLNYIRYLLDKPTRSSKHSKYDSQCKKQLKQCGSNTRDAIIQRNRAVLDSIRNF